MTRLYLLAPLALWIASTAPLLAAADQEFVEKVKPLLKQHCVECHGGAKPKADLALDQLTPDFAANAETWKGVLDRIADGSMPPKERPRPSADDQKTVVKWVAAGLANYQKQRAAADGRARLRRLNRVEYANTLRDLLGAEVDIETLPEDGVASGFDNVDAALDLSSNLLERYVDIADLAINAAFVTWDQPRLTKKRIELAPLANTMSKTKRPMPHFGVSTRILEDEVIFFGLNEAQKPLLESRALASGLYRFRIAANSFKYNKPMTLLIYAGNYGRGVQGLLTRPVGMVDVSSQPGVVEFTAQLSVGDSLSIHPYGLPNRFASVPADDAGPGLAMKWVEVEGPIVDVWPPAQSTRLLGGVDLTKGTLADAETILRRFAPRAFRRPVPDAELAPYLGLVKARFEKSQKFADSLRLGLKAILCSPSFLYLSATPGKLDDFDLATRLSYFLWSSTPDDVLTKLATAGDLGKPEVLKEQVERMLKDPKAHEFTVNFTGQWLSLRNLKATIPDKKIYPDFDDLLEVSMPRETHLFFEEVLNNNRSVIEFVHSDWTMLNQRLAEHYKIPGVVGSEFRKVQLPADSHRGGVLTQASVLKVTANGTNTSPVVRGAWVLDHILGTPPPPPPKDVPAIEPDIRGATTIREQLAKHRAIESCAVCHAKIDPVGNALENFDVIGGWRGWYRVAPGNGRPQAKIDFATSRIPKGVGKGPNVVAADELPGGRKFADVDGFKKLVLENPDQLASGLAEKLLVYATGHKLEFADREIVAKVLADIKPNNYGFRTLIHSIVQSPTFRSK
jgi:mono/diheme cytochrome c family protein